MPSTWIANYLIPEDSVKIGRFVLDVENPQQDFQGPDTDCPLEIDVTSLRVEDFRDTVGQSKSSGFKMFLSKLLTTCYNTREDTTIGIKSAVCMTYQLNNSGKYFGNACKSGSAREWLGQAIRKRKKVYLVVGIKTLTDAHLTIRETISRGASAKLELSGSMGGATLPVSPILDLGASGLRTIESNTAGEYVVPGVQIFAVQYRKVEFPLFSRHHLEKAELQDGNRWEVYLGGRGGEADGVQVVEPQMHGEAGEEEVDGNCDCETFLLGEEEILFVS